jgi:hypothetical protein
MDENKSIWNALIYDGIVLLGLTGLALLFAGAFAIFLSFSGDFLPHDAEKIGFSADELFLISENLVKFMLHDRAAFGGVLLSIGALYIWLAFYPVANGQAWAWKTFCVSGATGFGSFLLYLGYGHLDLWHAVATLCLLPIFIVGLRQSRKLIQEKQSLTILPNLKLLANKSRHSISLILFYMYAFGLVSAGLVISCVGITTIFVPSDIEFIQLCSDDIGAISDNLLGVIAHDRAGFGGALVTTGITVWLILSNAKLSKSLWQILLLSGSFGFISTIGIHFYVDYTDLLHVFPAFLGAGIFYAAIILSAKAVNGHDTGTS